MSSSDRTPERRCHARLKVRLPVRYGLKATGRAAHIENISEGGAYINTNDVYSVGSRLILRLAPPTGTVTLEGEVVWSIKVPETDRHTLSCGMGVMFLRPSDEWKRLFHGWAALIRAHTRSS